MEKMRKTNFNVEIIGEGGFSMHCPQQTKKTQASSTNEGHIVVKITMPSRAICVALLSAYCVGKSENENESKKSSRIFHV